jgi:2-oxoisovalerate dehydrogenase E2 component (dihydrolipoyl transacylase)
MGQYVFKLPDVGEGTAEAEIVAWHVKVGDVVEEDQNLVDVMTDKATVEMTAPVAGKVTALHGELGEKAPVGAPLVEFEIEGAGNAKANGKAEMKPAPNRLPPAPAQGAAATSPLQGEESVPSTPKPAMPKPVAAPSRPAFGARAPSALAPHDGVEDVKVIGLRRKIAEKMAESKRHIPHYAYIGEIDMTELEALRAHLNAMKREDRPKLTVLPFLMRALVKVLPEYPQINARFDDEAGIVHRHAAVHIGIATQTQNGLIVPVVRHAEALDIWQSAAEVARVSAAARENKAKNDELQGSTITITSLGALGGLATTPVINYPEVAIVGPNAIVERPVVKSGQIAVRKMMNLSSSFDHRVVDGYDAAAFIQRIKALLEHPAMLFME